MIRYFADDTNYDLLNLFCTLKIKLLLQRSEYILLLLATIMIGLPATVYSQHEVHLHSHPVLSSIKEAREAGRISVDEYILQQFYAAYRPDELQEQFRGAGETPPVKCMVPVQQQFELNRQFLSDATVAKVEQMTAQSRLSAEQSYISPSGIFEFHYDLSGTHAVPAEQTLAEAVEAGIPDYIYRAAFAADSSYRYQVEKLGFTDFKGDQPYRVTFSNFGFYGTTTSSGSSSYITLHNSFRNFPPNTHPEGQQIGALYVTIAHEIKHAIQYEANRWRGSAGSFNWIEMDATMMEEIVFDDVNDYYNYIKRDFDSEDPGSSSIFGSPQNPVPGAYWHISWMLYFAETYGMEFWADTWRIVEADPLIPFFDAVEDALEQRSETLPVNHLQNHLWHLGSGSEFTDSGFGFREREFYPEPFREFEIFNVPDSLSVTALRPMAANYIRAGSAPAGIGRANITVESSAPGVGVGAIGIFADGSVRHDFELNETSDRQNIRTDWDWKELRDLYITVVNGNRSGSSDYNLLVDSVLPEDDILAQNYPNPFNPTTRIEFSLTSPKQVRLEVYDSIGRKITTLLNEPLREGFHFVDFNGSGLSSGVYFYRIQTDESVTTRKMLLIK